MVLLALIGCTTEGRDSRELASAVQRSLRLMNEEDWDAAYRTVLTRNQRETCSLEEYAEAEAAGLAGLRESLGAGEISIIEMTTKVVGTVGLVTGTAIYTTELSAQARAEGAEVTGSQLRAVRNLGTATSENPDYWILEDDDWRWIQRRPDSPCFNEADLKLIESALPRTTSDRTN